MASAPQESAPVDSPKKGSATKEHTSTMLWSKVWEVYSPPPSNTIKGAVTPSFLGLHRRNRRITLEVHRVPTVGGKQGDSAVEGVDYYEECVIRVLVKKKGKAAKEARRQAKLYGDEAEESVMASVDEEDDESVVGDFTDQGLMESAEFAGWKARYRLPLRAIVIKSVHRNRVSLVISANLIKHKRTLTFEDEKQAREFCQMFEAESQAEDRRLKAKLTASLGDTSKISTDKDITLLVEIVSGWDLPAADLTSSDPYVACFLNGRQVHKTAVIPKTLDPIWTVKTGSLFLVTATVKELFAGEGLVCEVMDFDQFGKNDKLGTITVPPKVLYDATGKRMEYELKKAETGMLAIRCRRASASDIEFIEGLEADGKKSTFAITETFKKGQMTQGGKGGIGAMLTRNTKTEHVGDTTVTKFKVRPNPDPKRKEETKWMTKEEIHEECMKETQHWFDIGSGALGRVFVEILGCDGLPNLDTGSAFGNLTDTFVAVVFESSMIKTDVIDDCLSPRWLPWSKRGFVFHMMNSASELFLGVFDSDTGPGDHDLIGRVAVDLGNLRRNTTYTLKYDIYPTAKMTTRKRNGSITVRLRMEIDDERKLLLSSLEPPPELYVNVKSKKDFRVIRYTCQGKYDMEAYNMKVINSYVEELLAVQHVIYYLQDALMALLLWRGHFPVGKMKIPLHSINAFLVGIWLVERPGLMPSFVFASIAWMLLAVMGWRQNMPNPWMKVKSFRELMEILILGNSTVGPHNIKQYENAEKAAEFEEWREKRIREAEEAATAAYEKSIKEQEEELRELEEIGGADTDISTKEGGGVSFDVFKPFLYPIQQYLGAAVGYLRIAKNILLWNECYITFWITLGCFILSVAFYFVPWSFLIKWGSRIVVWTLLGPWMKLVDIFYVSKIKPPTEEEKKKQEEEKEKARRERLEGVLSEARVKREDASKLKAMKKFLFGKFIIKVPVLNADRYPDIPLPESQAVPYEPEPLGLAELAMKEAGYRRTRLPGQHLVGDMIPKVETKGFTEAPVGQATKHPAQLDKASPGAKMKKDSDVMAYAKIGTLVFAAGLVTWFGVPLLANSAEYFLGTAK